METLASVLFLCGSKNYINFELYFPLQTYLKGIKLEI
jgi:hypothetical protein